LRFLLSLRCGLTLAQSPDTVVSVRGHSPAATALLWATSARVSRKNRHSGRHNSGRDGRKPDAAAGQGRAIIAPELRVGVAWRSARSRVRNGQVAWKREQAHPSASYYGGTGDARR
jgi:hypothetical protein